MNIVHTLFRKVRGLDDYSISGVLVFHNSENQERLTFGISKFDPGLNPGRVLTLY